MLPRLFAVLPLLIAGAALADDTPPAGAAPAETPLKVAISPFPPLVFTDKAPPVGYSIDVWQRIAEELGASFTYVKAGGVKGKLDLVTSGGADVAIGGITLTADREGRVDFTHPTLEGGLSILVREDAPPGVLERLQRALSKTRLSIVFGFIALILIAAHLMWLAERGRESFSDAYGRGILEGVYWAVVTASTVGYGDKVPHKWGGRLLAVVVIVVSLPLFALFTAELASALTLEEIQTSRIKGPSDLDGRKVGVVRDTQSAAWASERGLTLLQYDRASELYAALLAGEMDAVVYDAPSVQYFAQHEGRGKALVVGEPFARRGLGIAVPERSGLRERINRALLRLEETGELQRIRVHWFG